MKKYKKISKDHYCIEEIICSCSKCNEQFVETIPLDNELVCFDKVSGGKVFLPTYGKNGYLDLLKKMIPEWDESEEISYTLSRVFEKRINHYTSYKVMFHNKTVCPRCRSDMIVVSKRIAKKNYPVDWMEIDNELFTK